MTCFPRSDRSYYLDDMRVRAGDVVVCRAAIASPHFTPGRSYTVRSCGQVLDDTGQLATPSARFTYS